MSWFKSKPASPEKLEIEATSNAHRSCLTDVPVYFTDEDKLNSLQYARALGKFIRSADTPVTLGIQGGWGSGKTSMFSLLRRMLEEPRKKDRWDNDNPEYEKQLKEFQENPTVCITLNAWEHSLFQDENNKASVVLSILSSLVNNILALGKRGLFDAESNKKLKHDSNPVDIINTLRKFMLPLLNVGMQFVIPGASIPQNAGNARDEKEAFEMPVLAEQIHSLKEKLTGFISCLKYQNKPVKVIIFIDDLDRVPPPTAVEILDVTKNIFDIKNCVFVLAIDYDVIVKGLEKKFGKRDKNNEREFRQYFDKIIQIPFTMPIGAFSRQIDNMLRNALKKLDYNFSEEEEKKILGTLAKACRLATGGLPRSLKRIVNTFSLLDYIAEESNTGAAEFDRKINLEARFIIVALHINFPEIFRCIMERPNFTQWNLKELETPWELNYEENEAQLESLANSRVQTYFDEDWEKIIFCLCSKSDWLKHNAINISRLVNLLRDVLEQDPEDEESHAGEARELSDNSVAVLRQLIESIRVISIDNELQTNEVGGNAAQARLFTRFCRKLAEIIRDEYPQITYEDELDKIEAEIDEDEDWTWFCALDGDVSTLGLTWFPESEEFQVSWTASRHGLIKSEAEELLEKQVKEPFWAVAYQGGKKAIFWLYVSIEEISQNQIGSEKILESISERAIEGYKLAKRISDKMKKLAK